LHVFHRSQGLLIKAPQSQRQNATATGGRRKNSVRLDCNQLQAAVVVKILSVLVEKSGVASGLVSLSKYDH
jgi:hypothetical protein